MRSELRSGRRMTRGAAAGISVLAMALALAGTAGAATAPSDGAPNCWFQTNGPNVGPDQGDWYTSSSSERRHVFQVIVPLGAEFPVFVRVRDAESTRGATEQHDEVVNGSDPTRFTLRRPDGAMLARQTFPSGSPRNSVFEAVITAASGAGTYVLISETGALPISGSASPTRNDDQNSFRVQVLSDGAATPETDDDVRIGFTRATIACTRLPDGRRTPLTLSYIVPDGAATTTLRNFDLDAPTDVTGPLSYTPPVGAAVTGTMSGAGVWSEDLVPVAANQHGPWTIRIPGLFRTNQVAFEAYADGQQLPVSVVPLNRPPNWQDPGPVAVSEPVGVEPAPVRRSIPLEIDEPDSGQTLSLSVPAGGRCTTTAPHPFGSVAFSSGSVVSAPGMEAASLELGVGARDAGAHCVRVRVADGGAARDLELMVIVTEANSAPTADAGPDRTAHGPGIVFTLDGNGSDADGDPLTLSWAQVAGPAVLAFPPEDPLRIAAPVQGSYTFELAVSDGDLARTDRVGVTVLNGAPRVAAPPLRTVPARRLVTVPLGSFADPGSTGPWRVKVRWGTAATQVLPNALTTGSLGTVRHKFLRGGLHSVIVAVRDEVGLRGSATFSVRVRQPCRVPNLEGRTLTGARTVLRRRNCALGLVTRAFSRSVRAGRVVSQRPRAGSVLPTWAKVRVTLSKGPRR
jgi:K319L-like, PKD domain/PASTA domain